MKHSLPSAALSLLLGVCFFLPASRGAPLDVTVQSSPAGTSDIQLRIDGTLVAKTKGATTLLSPDDFGAGIRMLWHPAKAAFRVGEVTGSYGGASMIGLYSFAAGLNPVASGASSVAIGDHTTASGSNDIALGYHSYASMGAAIGN